MVWNWLFGKKRVGHADNDPQMLGTRVWLNELREVCERYFDNREEGQRYVRELQVEWEDSWRRLEIDDALKNGLDRRALRLLRANDSEWSEWLDDERFWMPECNRSMQERPRSCAKSSRAKAWDFESHRIPGLNRRQPFGAAFLFEPPHEW